jgi:putative tryptophan/tyrosine transport system substrate-binding protein
MSIRILFLILLAVEILVSFHTAAAQQARKLARIGYLTLRSAPLDQDKAFKQALRDLGWIDGQNFTVEWRGAAGKTEKLAELALDLVRMKVDVIVASATPSVEAAKNATSTIPLSCRALQTPWE